MVALLLYCWARGTRSSRAIERACVEDVACRVIAAQQRPDHATIARFVVRHEHALGELFGEVLVPTSSPLLSADAGARRSGFARRCTTPHRAARAPAASRSRSRTCV
jgi:hypothetical protein